MTKDETLKLALEALERCVATCFDPYAHEQVMSWPEHFVNQTITAIKEALAQPEQDLSEQGRNRSAVLGNNVEAMMGAGLPFLKALETTLKVYDHNIKENT